MPTNPSLHDPHERAKPSRTAQRKLMRAVTSLRRKLGKSMSDIASESGYYSQSMLSLLELDRARMSRRGFDSLVRWVEEARAKLSPPSNGAA